MIQRTARRILGGAAAAVDRAATMAASSRRKGRAESLGHDQRMEALAALAKLYELPAQYPFFRGPRTIEPSERLVRWSAGGHRVVDITWSSDYSCHESGIVERFMRFRANHIAGARAYFGPEPRPVAILIHGYLAGQYSLEERVWPIEWLDRIGLDAVLFVLPFHGVRSEIRRFGEAPPFPGADPRMSNEGFRQAMGDLGDLVEWLRGRGHPSVGVMGMSLGGYSTALAATVVKDLAFAVPIIPLASIADFARDQGRLGARPEHTRLQHAALEEVHKCISPLHRTPLISPDRMLVVGARADRITPVAHARRIAHHFGAPLESWHGGHLLQFGRSEKFRRIGRLLDDLELTTRASGARVG